MNRAHAVVVKNINVAVPNKEQKRSTREQL